MTILALLSAIFGFAAPFLPELLKYFNRRMDLAHEKEMFGLRLQLGQKESDWRIAELDAKADVAEAIELHKPQPSWGVQLLDKAEASTRVGPFAFRIAFCLYVWLDWFSGMVRPGVAYWAIGFYTVCKAAMLTVALATFYESYDQLVGVTRAEAIKTVATAVLSLWTDFDQSVLMLVLGFWFGQRQAKTAFGGSAKTAAAGA